MKKNATSTAPFTDLRSARTIPKLHLPKNILLCLILLSLGFWSQQVWGDLFIPGQYRLLHSFFGDTDGSAPHGGLAANYSSNTLFGTTSGGGAAPSSETAAGTIFKIRTDGYDYGILHTFVYGPTNTEGWNPSAVPLAQGSTLSGTTELGGYGNGVGEGTIYTINQDGTGYAVSFRFATNNSSIYGDQPVCSLVGGGLYGTVGQGNDLGVNDGGVIFASGTYRGENISVSVNASAITSPGIVEFWSDGALLGTAASAPYSFMWTNPPLGTHVILAIAYDTSSNIAGSAAITVNVVECVAPPSNMVAWWQAESNFLDSVNGNDGTVTDGTVDFVAGAVGLGFGFDGGENRILVPDSSSLNFGADQDFSIEAWIQPDTNPNNDFGVMSIIDKRNAFTGGDDPNGYEFSLQDGQIHCRFRSTGFGPYGPDLRDGNFHHVALSLSRDSSTGGNFYVDGQLVGTFDPTSYTDTLENTEPLHIGNHAESDFNGFFAGIIDEVTIYNRALSSDEIGSIYNAGPAGKCR